jgi:hypothetical protein
MASAPCDHLQVVLAALSGWQTVLITLGASALTGAAALLVSWLNGQQETARLDQQLTHECQQQAERIQHERDEQWRDRLTEAAAEFSTGVQQALLRIHEAIQTVRIANGRVHCPFRARDGGGR